MTKGRKTTFEERVEIVQYCIAHDRNYAQTAEQYQVSYQQARNYIVKYEAGGVEALRDNRGSGTVIDKEKNTLPGVNIMVKGSSGGTITDMDGNFSLNVASKAVLVVSSIGYETQEVPVNGRKLINVVLKSDVVALKDVVVVGYG